MEEFRFFIHRDLSCSLEYAVYMRSRNRSAFAETVMMKDAQEGDRMPPMMYLSKDSLISLMDELWAAGIRPTEERDASPAVLKAKDEHIGDLRKIIFDKRGK